MSKYADLIAEARKAATLYGNDWGVLLIKLADALEACVREVGQMKTEEWLDKHFDRNALK